MNLHWITENRMLTSKKISLSSFTVKHNADGIVLDDTHEFSDDGYMSFLILAIKYKEVIICGKNSNGICLLHLLYLYGYQLL